MRCCITDDTGGSTTLVGGPLVEPVHPLGLPPFLLRFLGRPRTRVFTELVKGCSRSRRDRKTVLFNLNLNNGE